MDDLSIFNEAHTLHFQWPDTQNAGNKLKLTAMSNRERERERLMITKKIIITCRGSPNVSFSNPLVYIISTNATDIIEGEGGRLSSGKCPFSSPCRFHEEAFY